MIDRRRMVRDAMEKAVYFSTQALQIPVLEVDGREYREIMRKKAKEIAGELQKYRRRIEKAVESIKDEDIEALANREAIVYENKIMYLTKPWIPTKPEIDIIQANNEWYVNIGEIAVSREDYDKIITRWTTIRKYQNIEYAGTDSIIQVVLSRTRVPRALYSYSVDVKKSAKMIVDGEIVEVYRKGEEVYMRTRKGVRRISQKVWNDDIIYLYNNVKDYIERKRKKKIEHERAILNIIYGGTSIQVTTGKIRSKYVVAINGTVIAENDRRKILEDTIVRTLPIKILKNPITIKSTNPMKIIGRITEKLRFVAKVDEEKLKEAMKRIMLEVL